MIIWANPEHIGVLVMDSAVPRYLNEGPDYYAAIAAGPLEYSGPIKDVFTEEEIAANLLVFQGIQSAARAEAYRAEADPLYFKAQRGEATETEWLAKVAEIKARFPYPSE